MAPFHIALGGMRAPRAWASSSTLGIAILAAVADMSAGPAPVRRPDRALDPARCLGVGTLVRFARSVVPVILAIVLFAACSSGDTQDQGGGTPATGPKATETTGTGPTATGPT